MKNIQLCLVLNILLIFFSCTKDKNIEEEKQADINDITQIEIVISDINTTDINADITYSNSSGSNTNVVTKILYKPVGNPTYTEASEGVLSGLESGKKYIIKGLVEINGSQKESEEISFVTLGYYSENMRGELLNYDGNTHSAYDDRKYSIFNSSAKSNFESAPSLVGYLKVGNDSILLEDIEIHSNNELIVTIPNNRQTFFDNDIDYNIKKEFTIGLFSGDYYKEVVESRNTRSSNFWLDDTNHFTIYNKIPFIDEVGTVGNRNCDGIPYIEFSIKGGFGGMPSSSIERSPDNRYASILIIISRGDDILTVLDYDSLKDSSEPFDCEIEQYTAFLGTAGILTSMELTFNSLLVRLRASNYPSGNYTVEFRGIANDDSRWYSNTFDFVIE